MLPEGRTLGPYEILAPLGTGGMGEVYRAHDVKLNRDVAIKVLPTEFSNDAERMARFQREAQLLASLNHPNIASIYGLEESEGVRALVMELVEGPTLEERIAGNVGAHSMRPSQRADMKEGARCAPLPLDEALPIARQIAEGLEYAHEKGVIHRDLKPANVKMTPDGVVKILDFGLAKALEDSPIASDTSNSPTFTLGGTKSGVILGTAAYMSPEQARGKSVDRRTDVWGFGAVLYEILTGHQAFHGETVSDTLAAVIKDEPGWTLLPANIPSAIEKLLRRCLEKDPKHRLQAIGEARIVLEDVLEGKAEEETGLPAIPQLISPARRFPIRGAAAVFVLALAAVLWWQSSRPSPERKWTGELLGGSSVAFGPRISPDGQILAFQAMVNGLNQVAVMKPDSGNWTVLTHDRSRGQIMEMSWSPDGTRIYFDRYLDVPTGIYSVPVLGGEERPVLEDSMYPQSLHDGSLLVVRLNAGRLLQLHRFWPDTGRLQPLGAMWIPDQGTPLVRVFPDDKEAVFYGRLLEGPPEGANSLYAIDLASGRTRPLASITPINQGALPGGMAVTPDGRSVLVNLSSGNLSTIVSVPRDGSSAQKTLLTLTMLTGFIDVGSDGSLYLDQIDRVGEVLRYSSSGGVPEKVATVVGSSGDGRGALVLPDGRVLVPSRLAGRDRLLLVAPGKDPVPMFDAVEDTASPATLLGESEIAFLAGRPPNQTIAVASLSGGRILRRLQGSKGADIQSLTAFPDGKTLYYAANGNVWAIPAVDGESRKIHPGDGVAVDRGKQDLIIQLFEMNGARLVRVPLSGGPDTPIPYKSEMRLALFPLAGDAVRKDGRILVQVTTKDSWFWKPAVLDPSTGKLEMVPLNYEGDALMPAWTSDDRILSIGIPLRSTIWRFRQAAGSGNVKP
ncbi:MAG: serine/threonine-protein kinase [Acidobacteriia bacterium]|nr:serine/threonine-protein kinase [Terriglobia bacterium]